MTIEITQPRHIQICVVNAHCMQSLAQLLAAWLPDGRRIGREWVARNPRRADRHAGSFKINMDTGRWSDFATGDKGGDPVSLHAYLTGQTQGEAARDLIRTWGMK